MILRALIVDDEALARARVRKLLGSTPELEIIGECANGPEAITAIKRERPELVFLDVQMPEVSGLEVLRAVPPEIWPAVIFITAHDRHAVEAFEVHAVDYLLKPFSRERLLAAVERARERLEARDTAALNQRLAAWLNASPPKPAYLDRIAVKTGTQTLFVNVRDIDAIEAAANYAVLQAGGENHILRETITHLESRLPPRLFQRISRSTIVNLERVKAVQSGPRGESLVLLRNGRQLLMTRSLRELQEKLQFPS
jgi:two-component system LytT family response regulator